MKPSFESRCGMPEFGEADVNGTGPALGEGGEDARGRERDGKQCSEFEEISVTSSNTEPQASTKNLVAPTGPARFRLAIPLRGGVRPRAA